MSDIKKEIEQGMVKVVEDARKIFGYVPPKPKDDDPRWHNEELPEDDWRRDK